MGKDLVVKEEKALSVVEERRKVLQALIEPDDIVEIKGKPFKKKSYWRKLAIAFGVSIDVIEERKEQNPKTGEITYHIKAKAIAPNGQFVVGLGSCSQWENGKRRSEHDTRATAETRAKNRAISDMLAFGEVSYEEINKLYEDTEPDYHKPHIPRKTEARRVEDIEEKQEPQDYVKLILKALIKKGYIGKDLIDRIINHYGVEKWADLEKEQKGKIFMDITDVLLEKVPEFDTDGYLGYNERLKFFSKELGIVN